MRIVIDCNVFVHGFTNPDCVSAEILKMLLNSDFLLLYDSKILDEYKSLLKQNRFNFSKDLISSFIEFIENMGECISTKPVSAEFKDEENKKFYEVSICGKADYLLTMNKKHFPDEKFIVTPSEFIKYYIRSNI
ncbi:MAG: putative toxin-antitoxin system toxin component, PIN family [Ignavibacteria bacterium]|nr:putative toxin-antitoxin system toxin component, PIN family [Ignavibacteria bacterium]